MSVKALFQQDIRENSFPDACNAGLIVDLWMDLHGLAQEQLGDVLKRYTNALEALYESLITRAETLDERKVCFETFLQLGRNRQKCDAALAMSITEIFHTLLKDAQYRRYQQSDNDFCSNPGRYDFETEQICSGMVDLCELENRTLLQNIDERLGIYFGFSANDHHLNPLSPRNVCRLFLKVCIEPLRISQKNRQILLKQLDRHVLASLQPLWQKTMMLLDCVPNPEPSPSQTKSCLSDSNDCHGLAPISLSELLNAFQCQSLKQTSKHSARDLSLFHNNNAPLSQLLKDIDPRSLWHAHNDERPLKINALVHSALLGRNYSPLHLSANDDGVVTFVSAFFDVIAEDVNVHLAFRNIILRFQLSFLEILLNDGSFADKNNQEFQKIIDLLGYLGGRCPVENPLNRIFWSEIPKTVNEFVMARNYSSDALRDVFSKLDEIRDRLERQSDIEKNRLNRADEGGKALSLAIESVNQQLFDRLLYSRLPDAVSAFLVDHWRKVLLAIHLDRGESDGIWENLLQVVDDLLWILRPHKDLKSLRRIPFVKKDLMTRLSAGLSIAYRNRADYQKDLDQILFLLNQVEAGKLPEMEYPELSRDILEWHIFGHSRSNIPGANDDLLPVKEKYQEVAGTCSVGEWFDYIVEDSSSAIRCYLDSRDKTTGVIRFRDFHGHSVVDRSPQEFAMDLQSNMVKKIDLSPLFERTLATLSNRLKR